MRRATDGAAPGLLRRLQVDLPAPDSTDGDDELSEGQTSEATSSARTTRAESLRGRHGEVHRLRTVCRCLSRQLYLRARTGQPAGPSGQPGRALRLHLRDQL